MLHTQYGLVPACIASQKKGILAYRTYRTFLPWLHKKCRLAQMGISWPQPEFPIPICFREESSKKIILLLSENCCVSQGLSVVLMLLHGCIFLPELGNASGRCANQTTGCRAFFQQMTTDSPIILIPLKVNCLRLMGCITIKRWTFFSFRQTFVWSVFKVLQKKERIWNIAFWGMKEKAMDYMYLHMKTGSQMRKSARK